MKKKPTHGGKRTGSGAKKKEPTTTISVRVPLKIAPYLKQQIKELIKASM